MESYFSKNIFPLAVIQFCGNMLHDFLLENVREVKKDIRQKVKSNGTLFFFLSLFFCVRCSEIEMATIVKKTLHFKVTINFNNKIKLTRNELLPFIKKTPIEREREQLLLVPKR